jgi:hypothetical protein
MKYLTLIVLFSLLFTSQVLVAQAPETLWTRTYGGIGFEESHSVQQTTDGGYIIAGHTYEYPKRDFYLVKTNDIGDTLWTRIYGGSGDEEAYSVQQTSDGGYIITGWTDSYGAGFNDVWLIKTDASGDTLWTKTFGGGDYDGGNFVQQTFDGGYIIAGSSASYGGGDDDFWLIKTDASGDSIWTRFFGGNEDDMGKSAQQTSDGGYIMTGYTKSFGVGESSILLIKTDASGDTIWTKVLGGSVFDRAFCVKQTTDSGYIITGVTSSYGAGGFDVLLIKTDASGDTLWTNTFGGSEHDMGYSVQQTGDGGYIITGFTRSFGGGETDVWLIKTHDMGDTLWTKTYGGSGEEEASSVQKTSDGGYIITGWTSSYGAGGYDFWLIKTAPDPLKVKKIETTLVSKNRLSQN